MSNEVLLLRLLVSALGVLFVALGFVAAAIETFQKLAGQADISALPDLDSLASLLRAFNQVLTTLLQAPRWLLMIAVGLGLVIAANIVLR